MRGAKLLSRLRRAADHGPSDAGLLARFATDRDGEAFAELVRRHGAMVRGVCRRVLGNDADADDAFQGVFLVLARKAAAIRERHALANWLFGVARRVATRARDKERRRARHEGGAARVDRIELPEATDLLAVLDDELERLPERPRAAVLVCLVNGRPQEDAARELGWSLSTLRRRLDEGRELIRSRLTRRGFGAALAPLGPAAGVGADVVEITSRAAVAFASGVPTAAAAGRLAKGELAMIALRNVRVAGVAVLAVGLLGGAAWQWATASGGQPPAAAKGDPPAPKPAAAKADPPAAKDAGDDRIRPGQRLQIRASNVFDMIPISGVFRVEPSGKVAIGAEYGGRVKIDGLTLEEAEAAIVKHLKQFAKDPVVTVTLPDVPDDVRLRELELRVKQLELRVEELAKKRE
jgi:RNA polymerase sigma factor (sigma-70 family)